MTLSEYIDALRARPPLEYDLSMAAFWERYGNGGLTTDEFCYAIGFVKIGKDQA